MSGSVSDPAEVTRQLATEPEGPEDDEPVDLDPAARIGRYVVIGRLGRGGMGEVVAAYDPDLDRRVALKLIGGGKRASEGARARLVREAQALAKLSHPNVVGVFDVGIHDERVFIAMEHIEGSTLAQWLRDGARPWRQIVETMVAAGRGLAAAHEVGLVHRDFKPANVMVGDDRRVRVLDFGLARLSDPSSSEHAWPAGAPPERAWPAGAPSEGALEVSGALSRELTEAGTVMGTPGYMAPEQFFGGTIDPRTDQFAFCVTLFRALYRVAPFPGKTYEEIGRAVAAGGPVAIPATPAIPRAIRRALVRGLSVAADARFGSMAALLSELERGLGQRRRRLVAGGAGAGALALVSALTMASVPAQSPCRDLSQQLDGIWDDDRRAAVQAALLRTSASYAADTAERVRHTLDAYAAAWLASRVDACEATRVRSEQSEHLMDLRVACLARRREQLHAATDLLAAADGQVVQKAVDVAQDLQSVDACADADRLLADVAPPEDEAVAAEVEAIRAELARADVLATVGKYDEASHAIDALASRIATTGYGPLQAEAKVRSGMLAVYRGHPEEGLGLLDEALWTAIETGHALVEAQALTSALHVLANHRAVDPLALRHVRNVEAVLARLGRPPELVARAELHAAAVYARRREPDEAIARYQRAIELADTPHSQNILVAALANLGVTLGMRGDTDAAQAALQRALDVAVERLGSRHPSTATIRHALGTNLHARGDHLRAIEQFEAAMEIHREALGPEHPEVGKTLQNLALSQRALGRFEDALESSRRALELKRATLGPSDPSLAMSLNNHGLLLLELGQPREAMRAFEDALQIWGPDAPDRAFALASMAEAWLALGEPARGVDPGLQALALMQSGSFADHDRAATQFDVARVLWEAGADRDEARRHVEQARASYAALPGDQHDKIEEIDAWLADHP